MTLSGVTSPQLNRADFGRIASIAKAQFGLNIEESKISMIQSRLKRRIQKLNLQDFEAYCDLIEFESGPERDHFISAITTNVTHFFREPHHFKHFADQVLPRLINKARQKRAVRLWSAGCSSGAEPYSLAACIVQHFPSISSYDFRILATDLDPQVLEIACSACISHEQITSLSSDQRRNLIADERSNLKEYSISPKLTNLISFLPLNLSAAWPMKKKSDVIMCRNVAIYFDREMQQKTWMRFAEQLEIGGILYIGHSERLSGPANAYFEQVGVTTYKRVGDMIPSAFDCRAGVGK